MNKESFVYVMTNSRNGTLYVGVTSDLCKRVWEHKNKVFEGFTSKYNLAKWHQIPGGRAWDGQNFRLKICMKL